MGDGEGNGRRKMADGRWRRDERTKRLFAAVFNLPSSIFHLPELHPRHIFLSTWIGWEAGRALSVSVESGHPRSRLALARRRQVLTNPPHLRSGIPRAIFIPGKHSGSAWRFEEQLAADWPYSRGILTGARRSPRELKTFGSGGCPNSFLAVQFGSRMEWSGGKPGALVSKPPPSIVVVMKGLQDATTNSGPADGHKKAQKATIMEIFRVFLCPFCGNQFYSMPGNRSVNEVRLGVMRSQLFSRIRRPAGFTGS